MAHGSDSLRFVYVYIVCRRAAGGVAVLHAKAPQRHERRRPRTLRSGRAATGAPDLVFSVTYKILQRSLLLNIMVKLD